MVCEYKWIETPYDMAFTENIYEFLECLYSFGSLRYTFFKTLIHIIIESKLNITVNSFFLQNTKIWKKWFRILRPKHYKASLLETDETLNSIERICPCAITFFQTIEEPIGIECRNIRTPTC